MNEQSARAIYHASLRLLAEKGVLVENRCLLDRLAAYGAFVQGEVACFPVDLSEALLPAKPAEPTPAGQEKVTCSAELYQGLYLTLEGEYAPVTRERLLEYRKLSKYLPGVDGMGMLGCPIVECPPALQPLYEKLYCWKWGINGGDAIWDSALLGKLFELWTVRAAHLHKDVKDVFRGCVYMLSPLKLGAVEASHIEYFYKRGLRVSLGTMASMGATAPVTNPGALALQMAERMFIAHLMRALWGEGEVWGGNSLALMDMGTMCFRFGRPEKNALVREAGLLAKALGLFEYHHVGLSDAKTPSYESGVQKATGALMAALTGGNGHIVGGLLAVDEVYSPVQLALDGELCRFLNASLRLSTVDEETLALETLLEIPHGAMFTGEEHTARHFRESFYTTDIFSKDMFAAWDEHRRIDVDYARELCVSILREKPELQPEITEEQERDIMKIIGEEGSL